VEILWNIVNVVVQFVNPDILTVHEPSLFLQAVETWKALLTSQPIRPLFKAEKKKNTGIFASF
jgi:hypothetical protein